MAFVDHETTETHSTEEFKKSFQVFFWTKFMVAVLNYSGLSKAVSLYQQQQMTLRNVMFFQRGLILLSLVGVIFVSVMRYMKNPPKLMILVVTYQLSYG